VPATGEVSLQGDADRGFVIDDEHPQLVTDRRRQRHVAELIGATRGHDGQLDHEARAAGRSVFRPDAALVFPYDAQ